jgi:hypothetical protein
VSPNDHVQCDERTPSCSRCAKLKRSCHYSQGPSESKEARGDSHSCTMRLPGPWEDSWSLMGLHPRSSSPSTRSSGSPRSCGQLSAAGSPSQAPSHPSGLELQQSSQLAHTLNATELELFSHYLLHTSRIIPYDRDDLYALQVGFPSLAFRSKPVMSSILALAAVCKCNDLMEPVESRLQNWAAILELLFIADRHHRDSLCQIQNVITDPEHYDHILANATLMVLYGSANHWIRIQLERTPNRMEPLPCELLPSQPQWMSLIRAAHMAYVSLRNDPPDVISITEWSTESPSTTEGANIGWSPVSEESISPEDGPSERTRELLFPILSATSTPALESLRAKADEIAMAECGQGSWSDDNDSGFATSPAHGISSGLEACLTTLDVLRDIVVEVFATRNSPPPAAATPDPHVLQLASHAPGQLASVSPWVRSYAARVTSAVTHSRPLRRIIMSFLNQVSTEYFELVQAALGFVSATTDPSEDAFWDGTNWQSPALDAPHWLALNIFAHWLVLVMLLDGVWWIGGVGTWELERVVKIMRSTSCSGLPAELDNGWWPESMYRVGKELEKHGEGS